MMPNCERQGQEHQFLGPISGLLFRSFPQVSRSQWLGLYRLALRPRAYLASQIIGNHTSGEQDGCPSESLFARTSLLRFLGHSLSTYLTYAPPLWILLAYWNRKEHRLRLAELYCSLCEQSEFLLREKTDFYSSFATSSWLCSSGR